MTYRILSLSLLALALVLCSGATAVADDTQNQDREQNAADKANMHEGVIVSATNNKLVMKGKGENAEEHSHTVADNTRILCDGKECKLDDLKPGQKVRVTTKKGDKEVLLKIEALEKNTEFGRKTGEDSDKDKDK